MPIMGHTITVDQTLTVTLNAYTANDVVGGMLEFDVSSPGGGGVIRRISLVDDAAQSEPFRLFIFDQKPTTIANDAAYAPTIADVKKLAGIVTILAGDYVTLNGNVIAIKANVGIDYVCPNGKLYGYLVATDTPDYAAATDLFLRMVVWAD